METKQIQLDKHQHATLKRLLHVISKDELKPALTHLYYNPERKHVVATNMHSLRIEPFDFGDEILYISENEIKIASHSSLIITIERNKKLMWPKYERVIPGINGVSPIDSIGIESTNILNFMKSLEKDTHIKFTFTGDRRAVLVYNFNDDLIGVIMPCQLPK